MIDKLLSVMAPHSCCGCGQIGEILCPSCQDDIKHEAFLHCLFCLTPTLHGVCDSCQGLTRATSGWCVGWRSEALKRAIDGYKFERRKASYKVLARLLDATLPYLPPTTVMCYAETVAAHQRLRGYDHMKLIVKELAMLRGFEPPIGLARHRAVMQRGASRRERLLQMHHTLYAPSHLAAKDVVVVDDIVTTGATMREACRALVVVGARPMVAALARQPLDGQDDLW